MLCIQSTNQTYPHSNIKCDDTWLVNASKEFFRDELRRSQDVHIGAPAWQYISINRSEQGLRDNFEQLIRVHVFLVKAFTGTIQQLGAGSRYRESVVCVHAAYQIVTGQNRLPFLLSGVKVQSGDNRVYKKWSESTLIAGHRRYLCWYKKLETRLAYIDAFMFSPSSSEYNFSSFRSFDDTVWMSVANPLSPMRVRSLTLKILLKFVSMVRSCTPSLVSHAIAIHSFPHMPMSADPLYDSTIYQLYIFRYHKHFISTLNLIIIIILLLR